MTEAYEAAVLGFLAAQDEIEKYTRKAEKYKTPERRKPSLAMVEQAKKELARHTATMKIEAPKRFDAETWLSLPSRNTYLQPSDLADEKPSPLDFKLMQRHAASDPVTTAVRGYLAYTLVEKTWAAACDGSQAIFQDEPVEPPSPGLYQWQPKAKKAVMLPDTDDFHAYRRSLLSIRPSDRDLRAHVLVSPAILAALCQAALTHYDTNRIRNHGSVPTIGITPTQTNGQPTLGFYIPTSRWDRTSAPRDVVHFPHEGEPRHTKEIHVSAAYLRNALKACKSKAVRFSYYDELSPLVISHMGNMRTHVIMPIRNTELY